MHRRYVPPDGVTAVATNSPFGGVTMSMHKLTAGSGYDYLTRQVAALDATEKGHTGLASYYTERGESPGVWIWSGMDGIDGLAAGDPVSAEQMRALFGCGLHPLAELRQQQLEGHDLTTQDFRNASRLGVPFRIVDHDLIPFRLEVAKRIGALNTAIGWPADASIASADRARVRTQVAREFFLAEHGREPVNARELAGQIAKDSRPRTQTVAGYDLTFSPVKSVSTLWAVAEPAVAAVIERAHQAAVNDALAFIEKHALFPGPGRKGSGRSMSAGWSRLRSPIGTAGPETLICTPTWRSRTRCRPSTDGGCRSTDGCCSKPTLRRRRPTTPPLSSTSATIWGCGSPNDRGRPGEAAGPGDRRCRPATESALVDPPRPHQHPPRRTRHPIPR
jgi:TrwC relaxase